MNQEKRSSYILFGAMIATSTVVMFILMYLNTFEMSHVRWSETRVYMALIMGAAMAIVMLTFMRGMYSDKRINIGIYVASVVIFLLALFLVRSQTTVQDVSYMRAMIPHHSIAILTSERSQIEDLRVRELADEIIEAQRREIKEMNWLIEDIGANGRATTVEVMAARPVPEFEAEP
jgi:magnesium-transporting ATPase (P-type)